MGGCCSSSRKLQLHGTPSYYYYSPYSEEHESLTSHDGAASVLASRMFIDLDLNMSSPDTYRAPPAPIPYDSVLGRPQSTETQSGELTLSVGTLGKPTRLDPKESNCVSECGFLPQSPIKVNLELLKSNSFTETVADEEESCPTCLDGYNAENPKITTKCSHNFHLSCILEWMERSDTCPICNQDMIYEVL